MLKKISIKAFKRIEDSALELGKINVLVGGNNSGKSCFLQGIHFGIALSQSRRIAAGSQFSPESLRYCPTDDFLNLRHGRRLTEGARIEFIYERDQNDSTFVHLERGRNGVVKADYFEGSLADEISDPKGFFSIYVPGLAGITVREEYRSELIVNNGIARGDANLYLRNVLLRIEDDENKREEFAKYLDQIFPGRTLNTNFDEADDLWIKSTITSSDGVVRPIDMVGTGLLQAIQLLAYVTNYKPKLLLLDEPDAHLHPNNQRLLAETLSAIAKNTDTKIVLATHSRHLLDALSEVESAQLYWVKDGVATKQADWSDIAVLMDLGALDKGERFLAGNYRYLIWTEDTDTRFLETFLIANGVRNGEAFVFSYQSSSKIDAANLMANFVQRVRPGVTTIIHRDRDFLTDQEVQRLRSKYNVVERQNGRLFLTRFSDVESYFVQPSHIASTLAIDEQQANEIVVRAIQNNQNEFVGLFHNKRQEIKRDLYKTDPDNCPSVNRLLPADNVPFICAHGKTLWAKVTSALQNEGHNGGALINVSESLIDPEFQVLLN